MLSSETHPIPNGFLPEKIRILIVGTFPPAREYMSKKEGFFFYAAVQNHFWNRMDAIFPDAELKKTSAQNADQSFIDNRKKKEAFCAAHGLGFLDVFTEIGRKAPTSHDKDLIPVQTILENGKLFHVLENTSVQRICCTYLLAYQQLKTGLGATVQVIPDDQTANGEKLLLAAFGRTIEIVLLFPATRSGHKNELKDKQYRHFLFSS